MIAADAPAGSKPGFFRLIRDGGFVLLAVLAIATALRGLGLDDQLWLDEILMLHDFARRPVAEIVASYPNDNNHPLYSILAAVSVRAFGESPAALRLPAALFGVLSIAALYVLARRLGSRRVALVSSAVLALAGSHVFFSQNARGYTGLLFFALLATDGFLRAQDGVKGAWRTQSLALGFGAYCHLTGVFVGIAQAVVLLVRPVAGGRFARSPWQGVFGGGAAAVLLHLPMWSDLWRFFVGREDRVAIKTEWTNPLHFVRLAFAALGPLQSSVLVTAAIVGGFVVLGGVLKLERLHRGIACAMLLPAVLGGAATVLMGRHLWPRFFFFAAGFGVLMVVSGVEAAARRFGRARRAAGSSSSSSSSSLSSAPSSAPSAAPSSASGTPPAPSAPEARSARFGFGVAAGVLLVLSAATTRGAYGPKQDFTGPRQSIAAATEDPARPPIVFTAGLAMWPYAYLHAPEWSPLALGAGDAAVDQPGQLLALLAGPERSRVRVVASSPVFLKSRQPQVWSILSTEMSAIRRFGGTMGPELDVVVYAPRQ